MAGKSREWWPKAPEALAELQEELAGEAAEVGKAAPWLPDPTRPARVAAVFAGAPRGLVGAGAAGDPAWVAAALCEGGRVLQSVALEARFAAPYQPGLLARREGELLARAVQALPRSAALAEVLLVNATGTDHPRRAGLALHLGAALDLPSVGVTDRPLLASGPEPGLSADSAAELSLGGSLVGYRLRSRRGVRPVVVHAGWRVGPEAALQLVVSLVIRSRTPEPLRQARRLARLGRAGRLSR